MCLSKYSPIIQVASAHLDSYAEVQLSYPHHCFFAFDSSIYYEEFHEIPKP